MKKFITLILLFVLVLGVAFAASVKDILPSLTEDEYSKLMAGETLKMTTGSDKKIARYVPTGSAALSVAKEADASSKGFAVTILRFIPYSESMKNLSNEDRQLKLFNILTSISTQKGLTYISHLAGEKETVLIEDTYMISNAKDKSSKIEDPVFDKVPADYSCYFYQKDNRFGANVYQLDYKTTEDEIYMDISNNNSMRYMGVTCLLEGALHMYMDVVQTEEGFLLTSLARSADRKPQVKVVFVTVDLPSAFARRITSLGNWFVAKVSD